MKHNKLVRDKIPSILAKKGIDAKTSIVADDAYWAFLLAKLQEEVSEFIESGEKEELADIQEVMRAIYDHMNVKHTEIEAIREQKAEKRGAFKEKIVLHETNP